MLFFLKKFLTDIKRVSRFILIGSASDYSGIKKAFFTEIQSAVTEINKRQFDPQLKERVDSFLMNEIPEHFHKNGPILYLSRHTATPNFEALHFIEIAKQFGLPIVIGQDSGSKFVSINPLKKCLGKMSVVSGMTRYQDEIIENFTIINFNESEGKKMRDIVTKNGEPLVKFHNDLLKEVYPDLVLIAEEDTLVDKHRNNLIKQYEVMLALNCYYGVIFEAFPPEEIKFFNEIFVPAFNNVTKAIGTKPLVVELLSDTQDAERDWNMYPSVVYPFIKKVICL